jgi:hypothetical protein
MGKTADTNWDKLPQQISTQKDSRGNEKIMSVTGPNNKGEYRVRVTIDDDMKEFITKTPPKTLNEFAPPSNDRGDGGGEDNRSRRIRKLLEIAIQVAKQKNVDELGMIHAMNMIAGDDFFSVSVEGILPDITDKEYMFVLQSAYKTVKQGLAESKVDEMLGFKIKKTPKPEQPAKPGTSIAAMRKEFEKDKPENVDAPKRDKEKDPTHVRRVSTLETEKTARVFHPQYVDVYFLDGPRRTPILVNRKVPYNLIDRYLELAIKKYNLQQGRFEFRNAEEDPVKVTESVDYLEEK